MTTPLLATSRRAARAAALAILCALALVGCQVRPPAPSLPPPRLQLLGSAPFSLPATCNARGSYVVEFTVLEDGRTGAIKTPPGSSCVSEALSAWIASFRYTPQSEPVNTSVEWMLVSAERGS
jgi:hypothetical protein